MNLQLAERYRPKTLDDLVLNDELRNLFKNYIDTKSIPNLTLYGHQGIGKSTLAQILVKEIDATLLYINASVNNDVDTIRTQMREFCQAIAPDNNVKIVILDEADSLSKNSGTGSSAQSALRNIIDEAAEDTRIILTCNYIDRILDPIKSRCTPIKLQFSISDVCKKILNILIKENIKFTKDEYLEFCDLVIKKKYPDIRLIINILESWIITGKLVKTNISDESQIDTVVEDILSLLVKNPRDARKYYIISEDQFSNDYQMLAGRLFNKFEDKPKNQIIIADYLKTAPFILDKEIGFYAMLLQLT